MAADFRAARPEKAARELVIVVHLHRVGDAALTSPSRSLESVIGHCIRYCGANGCWLLQADIARRLSIRVNFRVILDAQADAVDLRAGKPTRLFVP